MLCPITFIKMFGADMIGGNVKALFAASGVSLCFVALLVFVSPEASASYVQASVGVPEFSFSDLLKEWGRALTDPAVYTSWMHIDGLFGFLSSETLASVFNEGDGGASRISVLGTIPNIFFMLCIITVILCIVTAMIGIRKAERSKRVIRR